MSRAAMPSITLEVADASRKVLWGSLPDQPPIQTLLDPLRKNLPVYPYSLKVRSSPREAPVTGFGGAGGAGRGLGGVRDPRFVI